MKTTQDILQLCKQLKNIDDIKTYLMIHGGSFTETAKLNFIDMLANTITAYLSLYGDNERFNNMFKEVMKYYE